MAQVPDRSSASGLRDPPRVFGRYVLLEPLESEGSVQVDLARKPVDRGAVVRFVVLKRIQADPSLDPDAARRFKDEAGLVSELQHPNLAASYDFGREGDEYYLAQEYVPGIDARALVGALRERVQRVPPTCALEITARVLDALDHVHRRLGPDGAPVLHLGVNARSVRLSIFGEVKLADLGLTRAQALLEPSRAAPVKGRIAHFAPEQLTHKPVDHRTDLYAVGLLLNELLTGLSPLAGLNHVQLVHRAMSGRLPELPPVPSLDDDTALRRIHDRAVAARAWERYRSAGDMAADLRELAASWGGPVTNEELLELLVSADPALVPRLEGQMLAHGAIQAPAVSPRRGGRSRASTEPTVELADRKWVLRPEQRVRAVLGMLALGAAVQQLVLFVLLWMAIRGGDPAAATSPVLSDQPVGMTESAGSEDPASENPPAEDRPSEDRLSEEGSTGPQRRDLAVRTGATAEPDPQETLPIPATLPTPASPPPPERPPPTPRPDFGRLTVDAPKGANVLVDGATVGVGPVARHKVPVGMHTVEVDGRACSPATVTVRKGQVESVTCK